MWNARQLFFRHLYTSIKIIQNTDQMISSKCSDNDSTNVISASGSAW